jgi:hypothetical protein
MTKDEIAHWVRQTLFAGEAIANGHLDQQSERWFRFVDAAVAALKMAQQELRDPLLANLPPPEDRNAPYVCMGCSLVYPVCPEPNAYDCPACGAKVTPVRLWARAVVRCEGIACSGAELLRRADGDCACPKCGLAYRLHPHCANSRLSDAMAASTRPEFYLHVLCNGDHVKL